ncbi:hypothetical protein [Inquilinus sp.]|uniref:hypothetical protein n=1 Tax=Inquilinus sp. TaxID=1932117 RepID=UPI0031D7A077
MSDRPLVIRSGLRSYSGVLTDLVVSADPSSGVTLQWLNGDDPKQLWTRMYADGGFYLRNVAAGTYLRSRDLNKPVFLDSHPEVWEKTGPDETFTAIRPIRDPDVNLNALNGRAQIGQSVGIAWWYGDLGKEVWSLADVAEVWPRPTLTQSFVSGLKNKALSINPADPTGVLVVDDYSKSDDRFVFTVTKWSAGFSIVNRASGKLAYIGEALDGAELHQRAAEEMDVNALWTYGGQGTFQAVRPWLGDRENWNIFRGDPQHVPLGVMKMGLWNWSDSKPNEIWQTVTVGPAGKATSEAAAE